MRVIRGSLMIAGSLTEMLTKKKKKQSFRLFFNFIVHKRSLNLVKEKFSIKSNSGLSVQCKTHISGKKKSKL